MFGIVVAHVDGGYVNQDEARALMRELVDDDEAWKSIPYALHALHVHMPAMARDVSTDMAASEHGANVKRQPGAGGAS